MFNLLGKKNAAKITALLASVYPALFKFMEVAGQAPANAGYGLGGVKGLKELPSIICQRVQSMPILNHIVTL